MGKKFSIGSLSDLVARPWVMAALFIQLVLVIGLAAHLRGQESSEGCLFCHADKARMEREGYPQFYVTREMAERESKMPGATCIDCHLGDGRSRELREGHGGMLRMLVVDKDANVVPRKGRMDSVLPTGGDRMYALFPKVEYDGELYPDPEIFTVLWHDRDPGTLGYDPEIAGKTCGKKGCHELEVEQFSGTMMGGNVRQRSTRHWMDEHGPNNCGPSFADLPPETGAASGFSEKNFEIIKENLSCPASFREATDRQRYCNVCHSGCLDCHYSPTREDGAHAFTRSVPSVNCNGGGRGTGMCHSGTQERRRGDTYLGAEFSQPTGMSPDPHVKAGLGCVDCHETGVKGMGDIQRAVDCTGCHYFISRAHEASVHRKMRCTACHVGALGGYQMTVWGRGEVAGRESPFKKYSLYYGVMERPVLMKDQDGYWTPYKAWPNSATNIKGEVARRDKVDFRWPKGETRDAYAFLGTYSSLPGANNALAWIQLEAVGHGLGKSRTCESCHASTAQRSHSRWEYLNYAGAEPFTGEQDVIADKDGLRITNIKRTSKMELLDDAEVWDFAAWLYLGDIWDIGGDFSIPKSDEGKYKTLEGQGRSFKGMLEGLDARLAGMDPGSKDYKALERRVKKLRGIGMHDPEAGLEEYDNAGPLL